MNATNYDEKLVITPLLRESQIGPASVDVRLGSSIAVPRRTYVDSQDVTQKEAAQQIEKRRYEHHRLQYRRKFILHPNELILGVTFEYISLPVDIFGMVASRSSWGRLGLVVATAQAIQPGYKGAPTLELVNLSESPIALYPGLPIGQLVFYDVATAGAGEEYVGRFTALTEAALPGFYRKSTDDELPFWGEAPAEGSRDFI